LNSDLINRFSSRRQRLDHAFLSKKLAGAKSYKRIAGYFRSSIFELVGEEIGSIPKVQIVCNSELNAAELACVGQARQTHHASGRIGRRLGLRRGRRSRQPIRQTAGHGATVAERQNQWRP